MLEHVTALQFLPSDSPAIHDKITCFYFNTTQTPDVPQSLTSSLAADDTHSICSDHGGSHLTLPTSAHVAPASPSASVGVVKVGQVQFTHILQKDCFLVFRSLCKLSMKGISDIHDSKSVSKSVCLFVFFSPFPSHTHSRALTFIFPSHSHSHPPHTHTHIYCHLYTYNHPLLFDLPPSDLTNSVPRYCR